ncbi:tyrosine-type recombinase/integrase [Streptomyces sp. NBC_01546]|uniref:tyrosine-type recombinase/integrase n=1 Tax=Streptomyces sp. NBC_01546 TaxID=2975872 RepID=UPI00386D209C
MRPHTVLDRLRQLSKEAGVPRVTVHDLRHLAATITITAGVPLTLVFKTLRHSTLSTTANVYSHLTQQAAREAVDTIDHTLTRAQKRNDRRAWLERLRPPRDHIQHLHEALNRLRPPPRPASTPPPANPKAGVRPHCDHQHSGHGKGRPLMCERTASDLRFRMVGTTGFEPATP